MTTSIVLFIEYECNPEGICLLVALMVFVYAID